MHIKSNRNARPAVLAFALCAALLANPAAADKPAHAGGGKPDRPPAAKAERGPATKAVRDDRARDDRRDRADRHERAERRFEQRAPDDERSRNGRDRSYDERRSHPEALRVGTYFGDQHRRIVHDYYGERLRSGHCPPGLAKKRNGCMPPGLAKKWRMGRPLPRDVVYYDAPRDIVLRFGMPPEGYRYVRVAADILLIAVGTGMVVDAIEDLNRF